MMHLDVVRSLHLIDRARQRIQYQKAAVTKLRLDSNVHSASIASDMLVSMEERLGLLLKQHGKLIANENVMEVSAQGSVFARGHGRATRQVPIQLQTDAPS